MKKIVFSSLFLFISIYMGFCDRGITILNKNDNVEQNNIILGNQGNYNLFKSLPTDWS